MKHGILAGNRDYRKPYRAEFEGLLRNLRGEGQPVGA
jgi:hypothetical protein